VNAASGAAQSKKKRVEESMLRLQKYSYADALEGHFKTKIQLISSYSELKKQLLADTQNHFPELRNLSGS